MAAIFMVSTAIAVAILYIVARISGRPFAFKSYWENVVPVVIVPLHLAQKRRLAPQRHVAPKT